MERIRIRELRQKLSVYVHRVVAGETLVVTELGRRVARLTLLPQRDDPIARLEAEGRIAQRSKGDLLDLGEPTLSLGRPLGELLEEMRAERL